MWMYESAAMFLRPEKFLLILEELLQLKSFVKDGSADHTEVIQLTT